MASLSSTVAAHLLYTRSSRTGLLSPQTLALSHSIKSPLGAKLRPDPPPCIPSSTKELLSAREVCDSRFSVPTSKEEEEEVLGVIRSPSRLCGSLTELAGGSRPRPRGSKLHP